MVPISCTIPHFLVFQSFVGIQHDSTTATHSFKELWVQSKAAGKILCREHMKILSPGTISSQTTALRAEQCDQNLTLPVPSPQRQWPPRVAPAAVSNPEGSLLPE